MTDQIWSARLRHRACGYNMSMSSADRAYHSRRRPPISPAPGVVDVDHPFDADSLYELRATLAAHASHLGALSEQIENLLIVATELATNAILHGGGNGRIKLWHNDNLLYCQVSDSGPGIADPAVGSTPPNSPHTDGGRGIWICRNLSTELIIEAGPHGHGATVTAIIPNSLPGP